MAEARAAVSQLTVKLHEEGTTELEHESKVAKSFFQDMKICAFRTKRQIYNGLWPTTWDNLLAALVIVGFLMYVDHPKINIINYYFWAFADMMHLDDSYPYFFRVCVVSLISALTYFIVILYTRQYLLRILLSYKGWLYQAPRTQSKVVLLWGLLVRLVSGRFPALYSYQNSLPRMPVPPLNDTLDNFLVSVKPVLDVERYETMVQEAKEFKSTIAPKLQRILQLKSWWARNYCTDWWEKYVYLMSRDSIAINSNYYVLDQRKWCPTTVQSARAAGITSLFLTFKHLMESERLEPLVIRNTIPLCMSQYGRMFGTSRIPKEEIDQLRSRPDSEHILVMCKGQFYKMFILDAHAKPLNVLDLQSQFEWILHDAESQTVQKEADLRLAALTGLPRDKWAKIRRQHFCQGINRDSIYAINDALFMLCLDDSDATDKTLQAKYLLHGDGSSIWFDKSFNLVFFKNGKMGLNVEHSWADAPVMGHVLEYALTTEYLSRIYSDDGNCKPYVNSDLKKQLPFGRSKAVITPMRLYWDINDELARSINEAYTFNRKNNEDLHLLIKCHDVFGKGFIKTAKVSPDAFIQIALQLAYYRDSGGSFALTYESSMTRLYLDGRTETVRSFSQEVKDFVLAMNDESVPAKECNMLMKAAASKHQKTYRDCMSGKGIDRHLFALYIVCRGQGHDSAFLKSALTLPWTLSTSQTPQTQINRGYEFDINMPEVRDCYSPGGGFGPVSDDGYGICYMMPEDYSIVLHVSSKRAAMNTDSDRFMDNIYWAMSAMKSMVEQAQ